VKRVNIEYTKQAVKQLERFDRPTKQRLKEAIEKIPNGDVKRLQNVMPVTFRLRVGDLRVLFTMSSEIVTVKNILSRGEAYKRV